MVVSIEISGPYEEKLRRLVELGIYASVAEAVRDALRRLMSELDMLRIALQIYIRKGSSIYYFCELAEEPCNKAIEYMLINQVAPRLGHEPGEPIDEIPAGNRLLIDPSTIIVAYNSLASKILAGLNSTYEFLIPEDLSNFERIYYAIARRHGIKVELIPKTIQIRPSKPPGETALTQLEYGILRYAKKAGIPVIVDDAYTRNIARSMGVRTVTTASLLIQSVRLNLFEKHEVEEIIFSLKAIPYLLPVELEEVIKTL